LNEKAEEVSRLEQEVKNVLAKLEELQQMLSNSEQLLTKETENHIATKKSHQNLENKLTQRSEELRMAQQHIEHLSSQRITLQVKR
jgi:hypothetical protein